MRAPPGLSAISVANLTIGRIDPARFVEEAAAAGFGRVGLLLASATPNPLEHPIVGRPEVMRATRAALQRTGTTVFDVEAFILSPHAGIEAYHPILAAGAELGATHISAIGAPVADEPALSPAQRIDLLGRLCDAAAGFGLHVGVEFMLYRDIRTATEALALVEATGRPNLGLILDALHIARAGTTVAELARLPAGRIAYAQLCDAHAASPLLAALPTEARTNRLHPGDGVLPLSEFLAMLPDGTPLAIETPVAAEAGWTTQARLHEAARRTLAFLQTQRSSAP
ncbi:MAG: sugar phosphate isomerase/epimerase family protein [Janthinobacterium lividum]